MSQYRHEYYPPSPRGPSLVVVALPVIVVLLLVVATPFLVWWLWIGWGAAPAVNAVPRAITPRGELAQDEAGNIELYEKIAPSVVHITTLAVQRNRFSMDPRQVRQGSGSGFVWDDQGHIVTNFHVIQGATSAQVTLTDAKGRLTRHAKLVDAQPDKDLAVLRIDAPRDRLHPIPVGSSHDLKVGQKVYAIGNPFGLDQTLTTGIISALNREIEAVDGTPIKGVIQTDAAINPGNSGGPLLDSSGRLIGVNTAIYSPSGASAGIGFAIPVDEVNLVVPRIVARANGLPAPPSSKGGRPQLGASFVSDQIARQNGINGLVVGSVQPSSPADKAGLRPVRYDPRTDRHEVGDIVIAIDGRPMRRYEHLMALLEERNHGDTITLTILREGQRLDIPVELEAW